MDKAIEFKNVSFSYKHQKVFQNFSLEVDSNQIISLVGINGSGKSTFLKLALGLLKVDTGLINILGRPIGDFSTKYQIGSTLQDIDFPPAMKSIEILKFVKDQFTESLNINQLIDQFSINDFTDKYCGQLSGGMKRRLALACAFVGAPQVVMLDEPTTGLDVNSRKQLMSFLKEYQEKNKALIIMINHHPKEVIGSVNQFFHIKQGNISRISPDKMKEFTEYRKITYQGPKYSNENNDLIRQERTGDNNLLIVKNADFFVKTLVCNNLAYKNIEIGKLDADELMEQI